MGLRRGGWVGGLIGGRRYRVVVRAVSFGGVCIRDVHAMRKVPPVLSECMMHDAMVAWCTHASLLCMHHHPSPSMLVQVAGQSRQLRLHQNQRRNTRRLGTLCQQFHQHQSKVH